MCVCTYIHAATWAIIFVSFLFCVFFPLPLLPQLSSLEQFHLFESKSSFLFVHHCWLIYIQLHPSIHPSSISKFEHLEHIFHGLYSRQLCFFCLFFFKHRCILVDDTRHLLVKRKYPELSRRGTLRKDFCYRLISL